jgi:hypothetical protein
MRRLDPPGGAPACELMRALYPVRLTINVKCTLWLQRHPHLPAGEPCTIGITDRYREMTSTFFAKLANSLGAKQRPAIVPLSESLGPPGPQTSHSTSSRISSLDQIPMSSHPTLQFSNSQTNSSFPFSIASPRTRGPPFTMHGSVTSTIRIIGSE